MGGNKRRHLVLQHLLLILGNKLFDLGVEVETLLQGLVEEISEMEV